MKIQDMEEKIMMVAYHRSERPQQSSNCFP